MDRLTIKAALTVLVLFVAPLYSEAVEWAAVGYGTMPDSTKFNVFIDTDSIKEASGQMNFWQGHVFSSAQPLPNGNSYLRISILRSVNCSANTDGSLEAVFYGADGSIVDSYSVTERKLTENPVEEGTISDAVMKFVCGNGDEENLEN